MYGREKKRNKSYYLSEPNDRVVTELVTIYIYYWDISRDTKIPFMLERLQFWLINGEEKKRFFTIPFHSDVTVLWINK